MMWQWCQIHCGWRFRPIGRLRLLRRRWPIQKRRRFREHQLIQSTWLWFYSPLCRIHLRIQLRFHWRFSEIRVKSGHGGSFRGQKPTYKFLAVVFVTTFNFDIVSGDGIGNSGYSIGRWGQLCFGGTDGFSKGHTVVDFDAFPGTYQWHSKNKIWKNFEKFLKNFRQNL